MPYHPRQARFKIIKDPITKTCQEAEKAEANDDTWDVQHTLDTHNSPEESLIPGHLLLRSVWPRYDEGAQEAKKLRSTIDLRQSLKVGREIIKLKERLQEDEMREKRI